MALIVEDGTNVANAESYLSVEDADTYWSNRNDTVWSGYSTPKKEAALRAATQYIDSTYEFESLILTSTQALKWPRGGFYGVSLFYYEPNTVPKRLKDAVAELAYDYGANGALMQSDDRGNAIKRVKAGSVEVEYADGAPTKRTFPLVNRLLADIVISGTNSSNVRLQRV